MKVLLTGSTGQVGYELARSLQGVGEVVAVDRGAMDLSDLDQSTLNLVTGEAGNFLSPYYMDQWQAWYQGYTFKLPYTRQAVAAAQQHVLTLEPN